MMARYFDVTFLTPIISLDAERKGQASFTVTNATAASIRGDAVVIPQPGAQVGWFKPERPSRHYPVRGSEQIGVAIEVPKDVPPGRYGFRLRMLLGGGVPEEQFDDSPIVQFEVTDEPIPIPIPTPPPKKFPWWLVIVIGVVVALIVIGALVWFFFFREPPLTGDAIRIVSVQPAVSTQLRGGQDITFTTRIQYSLESRAEVDLYLLTVDYPNGTSCPDSERWIQEGHTLIPRGTGEVTLNVVQRVPVNSGRLGLDLVYYNTPANEFVKNFNGLETYCYRYDP